MRVSTKGRYALRIMSDLAMHDNGEYISLKEVAGRQNITIKYLEQIIPLLSKAGYLKSSRGNNGGYRIARPAKEYTVGDILRVSEGSLAPIACLDTEVNECERASECVTLSMWQGLYRVVNDYLDNITLEQLVDDYNSREINNYYI